MSIEKKKRRQNVVYSCKSLGGTPTHEKEIRQKIKKHLLPSETYTSHKTNTWSSSSSSSSCLYSTRAPAIETRKIIQLSCILLLESRKYLKNREKNASRVYQSSKAFFFPLPPSCGSSIKSQYSPRIRLNEGGDIVRSVRPSRAKE